MITRQRLMETKRAAKKMDYHPTTQTVHMLVDACLDLMDKVDGGQVQQDWEQVRRNQEAQIRLALRDLRAVLLDAEGAEPQRSRLAYRARYTLDMIVNMLAEKRLEWRKQWDWYRPRIAEEFGDDL